MAIFHMILKALLWLYGEAKEKLSFRATWHELKELGKKHGRRFFVAAVLWEIVEDVVFPAISVYCGHPELVVVFLVIHFEPIIYPCLFWAFRMYDRFKGRVPWEPERSAMSSYWRTAFKSLCYRICAVIVFWGFLSGHNLNRWALTAYMAMMMFFGYVHDRIWHDWNWGITPDDQVLLRRTVAKILTYRGVSILVMAMALKGLLGHVPVDVLFGYQVCMLLFALAVEWAWSQSAWGIQQTHFVSVVVEK